MTQSKAGPFSHEEAFDLIPWSITGRIAEEDQKRMADHLLACAAQVHGPGGADGIVGETAVAFPVNLAVAVAQGTRERGWRGDTGL